MKLFLALIVLLLVFPEHSKQGRSKLHCIAATAPQGRHRGTSIWHCYIFTSRQTRSFVPLKKALVAGIYFWGPAFHVKAR